MQRWCLSVSVRLCLLMSFSEYLSIITAQPGFAREKYNHKTRSCKCYYCNAN